MTRRNKILLLTSVLLITACEFSESVSSYLSLRLLLDLLLWISELLFDCTREHKILTRRNKILLLTSVLLITACEFSESIPSYLSLRLLLNLLLWIS